MKGLLDVLEDRLVEHDEQRREIQERVGSECARMRAEIDLLEERINESLEVKFNAEDHRLQVAVNELRGLLVRGKHDGEDVIRVVEHARAELLVLQSYNLSSKFDAPIKLDDMFSLSVSHTLVPKTLSLENRKVTNLSVKSVAEGRVFLSFDEIFNQGEVRVLKENGFYDNDLKYTVSCREQDVLDDSSFGGVLSREDKCFYPSDPLRAETSYALKVRVECKDGISPWSDEATFTSSRFDESSAWRHCPEDVNERYAYVVSPVSPRVATRLCGGIGCWATVIGNVLLPVGKTVRWSIRLLKSRDNGRGISVGVAPFDILLNVANNGNSCGWYFNPSTSTLRSGPPHHFNEKKYSTSYNSKKKGDIEVTMSTLTGDLSFSAPGKSILSTAYKAIPLDKPLVPCVLIYYKGDSIELVNPTLVNEEPKESKEDKGEGEEPTTSN